LFSKTLKLSLNDEVKAFLRDQPEGSFRLK